MKILKSNGRFTVYNKLEIADELKIGNYRFNFDSFGNCYLEELSEFSFPDKIYDVDKKFRNMVIKSYNNSKTGLGVLLEGYKGQGKTITAKLLCKDLNLPVIIIDKSIPAKVDFIGFFSSIEQDYILFIDEFEKSFEKWDNTEEHGPDGGYHKQDSFLSFMDGAISTSYKKLFLFTTNESVNDKLINRPSRVMWHKKYQFLSREFFDAIVEDKLVNKEFKEDLEVNLPLSEATVDLLLTIIGQINLFDAPYSSFKDIFNHSLRSIKYKLSVKDGKKWVVIDNVHLTSVPTREEQYIYGLNVETIHSIGEDEIIFDSSYRCKGLPKELDKFSGWTYKFEKVPEFREVFAA